MLDPVPLVLIGMAVAAVLWWALQTGLISIAVP